MRPIVEISGVGQVLAAACAEKGFRTVEDIASAKVADLVAVPGVSTIRANQLIQAAQGLLHCSSRPDAVRARPSQANMPRHEGNASQPVPPVTNGVGDQSGSAQSSGELSALPSVTVSVTKAAPTRQDTAKKKKKQKTKAAEKKRSEKGAQTKKRADKKTKNKDKAKGQKKGKKSKKNNKNKVGKKSKSRRNKKKSGKRKS